MAGELLRATRLLASFAATYGDAWSMNLLDTWNVTHRHADNRTAWIGASFRPLSDGLRDAGASRLADHIAALAWERLWERLDSTMKNEHFTRRRSGLAEQAPTLARLLGVAPDELGKRMAEALRASGESVLDVIVPALRAHQSPPSAAAKSIAREAESRLTQRMASLARDSADWSIVWSEACSCDLCSRLTEFLSSRTERTLEWPLAEQGRRHLEYQIESAEIPVRHTVRKQGRPYTLLLTKTDELFHRDNDMRQQAETDLAWVTATFG